MGKRKNGLRSGESGYHEIATFSKAGGRGLPSTATGLPGSSAKAARLWRGYKTRKPRCGILQRGLRLD